MYDISQLMKLLYALLSWHVGTQDNAETYLHYRVDGGINVQLYINQHYLL